MDYEVQTRQQLWGDFEQKWAEAAGTHVMPQSLSTTKGPDKGAKFVIPKVGSAGGEECPDDNLESPVTGEQPAQNPQAKPVSPRVDVSGKEPPKVIQKKEAQYLALPSVGRYPLDSYTDVEKAASYYGQWSGQFSPTHRREFCSNLVKRAHVLGIPLSGDIEKYGSAEYAPSQEIEIALGGRRNILQDDDALGVLEKLAEARPLMQAELFAETLSEFDKVAGIDHMYDSEIMDPFYSTFGKTAEEDGDNGSHVIGNDVVTNKQLKELSKSPCADLSKQFGDDFVKEFRKDPIAIFSSMPADQKKVISRHANMKDHPTG